MSLPSPLEFDDYREYLVVATKRYRPSKSRSFSLRKWGDKLGYRSSRTLGMVLSGRRFPSAEMVERLSQLFKLKEDERRFLELLIRLHKKSQAGEDIRAISQTLQMLKPHANPRITLTALQFEVIAEWYHLVIKQLVGAPRFLENSTWISKTLRSKISPEEASQAISNLLKLGILTRHPNGTLQSSNKNYTTELDTPMEAGRMHHEQMLERAKESLREQSVEQREYSSKCFRMDPHRLNEAKTSLRRFQEEFLQKFQSDKASAVYQFNYQLFNHTVETL